MIELILAAFGSQSFSLTSAEKEIRQIETHLNEMLEDSNAFTDRIDAQHIKATTVALARTVAELGGLNDERRLTDIN